jgi:hypothetical protein
MLPYAIPSALSTGKKGKGKATVSFFIDSSDSPPFVSHQLVRSESRTKQPPASTEPSLAEDGFGASTQVVLAQCQDANDTTFDPVSDASTSPPVPPFPPTVPPRPRGFNPTDVQEVGVEVPGTQPTPNDGKITTAGKWMKGKGKALTREDEDEWERLTTNMKGI